jgi:two-component system OmpR family sensor kinase
VIGITVEDDGPGVPEEAREKIFEPFFRIEGDRDDPRGGAGLGLAIVRRILSLHGGDARVTDGRLGGARFTITFPARQQERPPAPGPAVT